MGSNIFSRDLPCGAVRCPRLRGYRRDAQGSQEPPRFRLWQHVSPPRGAPGRAGGEWYRAGRPAFLPPASDRWAAPLRSHDADAGRRRRRSSSTPCSRALRRSRLTCRVGSRLDSSTIQICLVCASGDWPSRRLATVLAATPASESDLTARVVGANPRTAYPWSSANSRIAPTVVVFAAPARPSIEVIQSVDASVSSATAV